MNMNRKNPFTALGINPNIFRGLSDDKIRSLVSGIYQSLAKVFHPDKGGSKSRFVEIQKAKEIIDDDIQFLYWRTWINKKKHERQSDMQEQIDSLSNDRDVYIDGLQDLITSTCLRHVTANDVVHQLGGKEVRMLVENTLHNEMIKLVLGGNSQNFTKDEYIANMKRREFILDKDGGLSYYNVTATRYDSKKETPDGEWISPHDKQSWMSISWKRHSEHIPFDGRLVGSIAYDLYPNRFGSNSLRPLITSRSATTHMKREVDGYSWNDLKSYAHVIRPIVRLGLPLLTLEDSGQFRIIGKLSNIQY